MLFCAQFARFLKEEMWQRKELLQIINIRDERIRSLIGSLNKNKTPLPTDMYKKIYEYLDNTIDITENSPNYLDGLKQIHKVRDWR